MYVDSHIHLHSCFNLDALLDSAVDNFRRAGGERDGRKPVGCLALTETSRDHVYAAIVRGDERWRPRRWSVRATDDDAAIVLRSPANDELIMLAGSQIATSRATRGAGACDDATLPGRSSACRHASRAGGGWRVGRDSMGIRQVVDRARVGLLDSSPGLERAAFVFARRQRWSADGNTAT